jgi:PAS domain S-box-containing protein
MQDEIRKSGIAIVGDIPWGTHFCQFYQTKQDLIDTLVPYFKAGLENNEFCMWVTADNLTVPEARKAMTKGVPGFAKYQKNGQIEILPYDKWYIRGGSFKSKSVLNGWIKKLDQALKKGYSGLRLTGNTFWLEKKDWRNFTDYEEAVNNVIGKYKMVALCSYSLDKCSALEIADVIGNHEFALIKREGKWETFENARYKTVKEDLIESEKRFRLALKNTPVTVAAQDRNLHFLWAYNQRTVPSENVIGKTDFELFPKTVAKKLSALKFKVMETGKPLNTSMWVTSNKQKVYLELYFEPMRNENGETTGVEVATVNLTREKLMEKALKESEDRYYKLFENMSEGIALCEMIFDKEGKPCDYRFINTNFRFDKFAGLSRDKIAGKTIREIMPNVQQKAIETFGGVVSTGKPVHFENYSRDLGKWFDVYAYRTRPGQFAYMVIDITERKLADQEKQKLADAIQLEKDKLSALVNSIPDEVWFADNNKEFTLANPSALREFGDKAAGIDVEALARSLEVLNPDGSPRPVEEAPPLRALKGETINHQEEMIRTPASGELHYRQVSAAPVKNQSGEIIGSVSVVRDISDQKAAEKALKESEEKFRALSEASPIIISVTRVSDSKVLYVNKSYSESLGYKLEQLIGKPALSVYYDPAERKALIDKLNEQGFLQNYEVRVKKADGTPFWASSSVRFINFGGERAVMNAALDISERKKIEHALKESNDNFKAIASSTPDHILVQDSDLRYKFVANPQLGLTEKDMLGKTDYDFLKKEDADNLTKIKKQVIESGNPLSIETSLVNTKGGTDYFSGSYVPKYDEEGKVSGLIGYFKNITEQKRTENDLTRLNRELQAIRECDQSIVHSPDESTLFTDVCRILCTTAGYRLAWVGVVEHNEAKSIRPLVWQGDGDYLASANITWADTERGNGPTGLAARTGKTHFFQDFAVESNAEPWRKAALARGYRSSIAIPLKDNDKRVFAVLSLYSSEPNSFNPDEIRLLEELASDISFGIVALSDRIKRREAERELAHLASFPEQNPNPIVEIEAGGKIVYLNPAAKSQIKNILESGTEHPFLTEWNSLVQKLTNQPDETITRQIEVFDAWYEQTVTYSAATSTHRVYARNVTERKKAADALKESEENNRLILETALDGVWTNDLSGRLLYVNDAYCQMIGYTREELLKMYIFDIEAVEKREDTKKHIEKIIRQGADQFETRHKRKDGRILDIEISAKYVNIGSGQLVVFARDITERKKAENTLRLNEHRFKILSEINDLLLTNQQPQAIIHVIADKVMAYLNCEAFFNFIVDEHSGRLKLNAYAGIPPEAAREIEWLDFGAAICGCVARDNQPIVSVDVQANGDERAALVRSYGIKAYASYPLRINKKTIGTVSFGTRSRTNFTYDELSMIEIVADQISVAMRRKQSEADLKASEERFYNAFHSSPVALAISRIGDGNFIDVNNTFLHLFGFKREELIGQKASTIAELLSTNDRNEIAHRLQQQDRISNYEVTTHAKNGSIIKIIISAEKIQINSQLHVNWTIVDITEREQAEELLRETSNYLNNLLDYANAPVIVWDPHFRISRFNPAFERLTGYQSHEVIGLGLDILFPPDKKAESMQLINLTLSGERWEVVEIPILRIDGEVRTVLWNSANVYDTDGKTIIATIAQGQDITERKLADEAVKTSEIKYRRLFEAAKDGILLLDAETGQIIDVNPFLVEMMGLPQEDFIGKHLWELGYFKDIVANKENFTKLQVNKYIRYEDLPLRTMDGQERKVEFVSNLYDVDHYKIIQCNVRDITARKLAEENIIRLNEELKHHSTELEAINKELEAFAYSVSHDLRAPLRSMAGFSQALQEDCQDILNDQCKDYLNRIQSSAELMAQLIDDLLQLSRLTRVDMSVDEVNLSEMAQGIAEELKKSQPKRNADFIITPGLTGRGDGKLLRIALYNLLENAWKFTGKVPVARIEFSATEENGIKTYYVRDNGAGFDMTYASKMFNPFQRLHNVGEFPGTGIGLASVQRVIHRHGGRVRAEGEVGKGATFYFTLEE